MIRKQNILLFSLIVVTLFCSSSLLIDKEVLPKWYSLYTFTLLIGFFQYYTAKSFKPKIGIVGIGIIIFISYLLLGASFDLLDGMSTVFKGLSFFLLFLIFKSSKARITTSITIVVSCVLQAMYGLLQYWEVISNSTYFPIVGSYDNPAGFAACLAVGFPLTFSLLKESKPYKLLALSAIIIIGTAIVLSESRAGIISIAVVSIIFLYYQLSKRFRRFKKYLLPSLLIAGLFIFIFLLYFKKDSALGRVLIWKVTSTMIQENPTLGGGDGSFRANYMNYQASYLIQNPESKYALLADNVLHPFNEYLLLLVEYGIIGFILLVVCVFLLFRSSKLSSPYLLCLVSLGIFSLFSYPLKYPFTWVIAAYCIAQIDKNNKPIMIFQFPQKIWSKSLVVVVTTMGLFFLIRDIKFEYNWNKVAQSSLLGKTKEMLPQYEKLYDSWNGNCLFLYNYGAELNHIKEYEKSIVIFNQCIQYWNDYDIQMIIADNYLNLNEWLKAEQHYMLAANMCPNRFVPLYKLHQLYLDNNRENEALEMAQRILDKKIKIPSTTVISIVTKMKKYLKEN